MKSTTMFPIYLYTTRPTFWNTLLELVNSSCDLEN